MPLNWSSNALPVFILIFIVYFYLLSLLERPSIPTTSTVNFIIESATQSTVWGTSISDDCRIIYAFTGDSKFPLKTISREAAVDAQTVEIDAPQLNPFSAIVTSPTGDAIIYSAYSSIICPASSPSFVDFGNLQSCSIVDFLGSYFAYWGSLALEQVAYRSRVSPTPPPPQDYYVKIGTDQSPYFSVLLPAVYAAGESTFGAFLYDLSTLVIYCKDGNGAVQEVSSSNTGIQMLSPSSLNYPISALPGDQYALISNSNVPSAGVFALNSINTAVQTIASWTTSDPSGPLHLPNEIIGTNHRQAVYYAAKGLLAVLYLTSDTHWYLTFYRAGSSAPVYPPLDLGSAANQSAKPSSPFAAMDFFVRLGSILPPKIVYIQNTVLNANMPVTVVTVDLP